MADIELSQAEADALISMEKVKANADSATFPDLGGKLIIPLISRDRRENFFLDVYRNRIDIARGTYQNRARQTIILVRLDFGGAPHRNPDGEEIPAPHLHLYRADYADKWAIPAPMDKFPNLADLSATLDDFMRYSNIVDPPEIERTILTRVKPYD